MGQSKSLKNDSEKLILNDSFKLVPKNEKETHLITGGLGHIGSYIVEHLAETRKKCRIVVVDNLYNGKIENIKEAKKKAKEIHEYKKKKMHIDGIREIDSVDGYKVVLERNEKRDQDSGNKYSYDDVKKM